MIYGIGIDLVKIERVKEAHEKWGRRFLEKFLTDNEIEYCFARKEPYPSLAVRFAAKEALIKAISSEIFINMKDVEIVNDESGKPSVKVQGAVETFFINKGIKQYHLSLSHEKEFGIACVVLEA
jgi:phosphopantetheine--protein transferase-like protein